MNEITKLSGAELTEKQIKAQSLHLKILTDGQIAAETLVELAKNLKEMRDTKLYMELGYDNFEAYCEEAAHIKQRQAYNFIKALDEFGQEGLQSNANLGITKLAALATLCSEDREQLMAVVDVETASTRELEEKIAERKKKCEQLTMDLDTAITEKEKNRLLPARGRSCLNSTSAILKPPLILPLILSSLWKTVRKRKNSGQLSGHLWTNV